MQNVGLNGINQVYFSKKAENNSGSKEQANSAEQKTNENNKLEMALKYLGAVGAAIALGLTGKSVYNKLNPKTVQSVSDTVTNAVSNSGTKVSAAAEGKKVINKFLTSSGEETTIKFKDGIAQSGDKLFSGSLEQIRTVNDKEVKTIVEYVDGKAQKTIIDDVVRKEFLYNPDGSKTIKLYDENSKFSELKTYYFDPNTQKASRVYSQGTVETGNAYGSAIDFEGGKVKAKTVFDNYGIENCEIYDENGKIIRTIKKNTVDKFDSRVDITDYTEEGTKTVMGYPDVDVRTESASKITISQPKDIEYKDKNGITTKLLSTDDTFGRYTFYLPDKNGVINTNNSVDIRAFNFYSAENVSFNMSVDGQLKEIVFTNGSIKRADEMSSEEKGRFVSYIKELIEAFKKEGMKPEVPYERLEELLAKI